MGYCPVSSLGHDTMGLYCDTIGKGAQPGATIRPVVGHDTASHGPRYGQLGYDKAGLRAGQAARA